MAKYLTVLFLLFSLAALAEKQPFERYQPIIDRQMFGQPPPGFDPTKMASEVSKQSEKELTKEQEQIRSSVHFSIINVTPSGKTAVGFTDNSDPKTPVHYYLKVGESSGGWTLKEADALKAWMKIEKNGVEVELTLGQNSGKGGGTTSKVASSTPQAVPYKAAAPSVGGNLRTPRNGLLARKANDGSTLQSFAQRKAEREAKRLEEEKRREEEKAQQEAEREEMRQSLADMKEQLAEQRRLREEAAAKAKADAEAKAKAKDQGEGEGEDNQEGEENEENDD